MREGFVLGVTGDGWLAGVEEVSGVGCVSWGCGGCAGVVVSTSRENQSS